MTELLELPDLHNLRDVGGLRTSDGRRTSPGLLYRSATPSFLDARQATTLVDGLGIRLRIDLRSRGEVANQTSTALAKVEQQVLLAPLRSGGRDAVPDIADPTRAMVAHYLRFLEHAVDSFGAITSALVADGALPALVHCTMGKDRTGAVVAVLLSAVGAVDEDVVADYALTAGRTDALLARLAELPAYAERLTTLPAEGLEARAETMADFLAGLRATYGDARGYLTQVAGVPDSVVDELRDLLISPQVSQGRRPTGP